VITSRANSARTLDIDESLKEKCKPLLAQRKKILDHYQVTGSKRRTLVKYSNMVLRYEQSLISAHIKYLISKSPDSRLEAISDSSLPVTLKPKIRAPEMGFKNDIEPDFLFPRLGAIGELKSGDPKPSDRTAVTGYALAYEKQEHEPIDIGLILYVSCKNCKTPSFNISSFVISDVDRRGFVENRNNKATFCRDEKPV